MLNPDFSLTAWMVSKCPHQGHRLHTEATISKRGGGVCGLCWPGCEREERSAVHTLEGGGALGYVGVGGEVVVCCLTDSKGARPKLPRRIEKAAPKVALLIAKGARTKLLT